MPAAASLTQARKQPRQARSAATVDTLLEAAARILETAGLEAFNTNAVAEKAGVSVGSLYQYFPAKQALLAALIRRERAVLMREIQQVRDHSNGRDLAAVLDRFIEVALRHQLQRPALARCLEFAEATLPLDDETERLQREIAIVVTGVLRAHGVGRPATVAQDLAAITRGLVDAAGRAGETDVAALRRRVRRAVHGYLGPQGARPSGSARRDTAVTAGPTPRTRS